MQTWEYAQAYAIRTFAFVYPFYSLGALLATVKLSKASIFLCVKIALSSLATISNYYFLLSSKKPKQQRTESILMMISSPGIILCSSSFLPSSLCSSLVSLSFGSWIVGSYNWSIFLGALAVIWSGWPFIGVIFVPVGIFMLIDSTLKNGIIGVIRLIATGLAIVLSVSIVCFYIDFCFYNTW